MKIALIEFGLSHEECIYSQLKFIKHDHTNFVTLICPQGLARKINFLDDFDDFQFIPEKMNFLSLLQLRQKIIREKYTNVVINTAQSNTVRNFLILPFPKRLSFAAVAHKTNKLKARSIRNFLIRRMKKIIVLNDYLLKKINRELRDKINIESSYMMFYPPYRKLNLRKPEDKIWICVPGQVEMKRRDYLKLFNEIKKYNLSPNINFIFLGNSLHRQGNGKQIKSLISELHLESQFLLWNDFIDINEFHSYVEASDYILPLIHPDHESYSLYNYQISGSFNLAFGYRKGIILHKMFKQYQDFSEAGIFYGDDDLIPTINSLEKPSGKLYTDEKWSFEYQAEKYLNFISN